MVGLEGTDTQSDYSSLIYEIFISSINSFEILSFLIV